MPADWDNANSIAMPAQNAPSYLSKTDHPMVTPPGMPSPVPSSSTDCSMTDVCNSLQLTPEDAEKRLGSFRTHNMRFIPFIHIPSHMTSQQLRVEKPFVWLTIMAVLTPAIDRRELVFAQITNIIHQKILVEVAPNMDMLLGLMVFITW